MPDFTLTTYKRLLDQIVENGYGFQTFDSFLQHPGQKIVILRHDIDDRKEHALQFARIQAERNIKGSYYFRMVPQSFDKDIIREIAGLGHEIGYHYETMDSCRGNIDKAYTEFCQNLEILRSLTPVSTICMHGSPRSPYDNRALWNRYDYRSLGIIGEPYLDLDFNKVAYLTDTGRKWNGDKVSIRDKVKSRYSFDFRTTLQLIGQLHQLPAQLMLTFHPQRWSDKPFIWGKEFILQNIKNLVKSQLVKIRKNSG